MKSVNDKTAPSDLKGDMNMTSVAGKEPAWCETFSGACATVRREKTRAFERFPQILHWNSEAAGAALIHSAHASSPLLLLSLAELVESGSGESNSAVPDPHRFSWRVPDLA